MDDLKKSVEKLGALPQKAVTPAARKGSNILLKAIKATAPVDTGTMKKALKLKPERSRKKGKKVYQVTYDSSYNDQLVKVSKDGKRSYYPASQEYGFFTRSGSYIPGYHFMRDTTTAKASETEKVIVKELIKNVDKEWAKKNGN